MTTAQKQMAGVAVASLILAACVSSKARQESPRVNVSTSATIRESRIFNSDDALGKAYRQTYRSVEAAEQFIREYPQERDLCAGALLNIAALQERRDKKKAIESYLKAVAEYADEIVPDKNAGFTVANWALLRIARLERDAGNRKKALEIFAKLMTSGDFNTRTSARIEYLACKQSHLQVTAAVGVLGKGPFFPGCRIQMVVSLKNPTQETVVFNCYVNMEHSCCRATAPREGNEEITLEAGERLDIPMVFTEKDTKGLVPGLYEMKVALTGIAGDTTSALVEIRN